MNNKVIDHPGLLQEVVRKASEMGRMVQIQKMSATTYLNDVSDERARALAGFYGTASRVWRARIGRGATWHYGSSLEAALSEALREDAKDRNGVET